MIVIWVHIANLLASDDPAVQLFDPLREELVVETIEDLTLLSLSDELMQSPDQLGRDSFVAPDSIHLTLHYLSANDFGDFFLHLFASYHQVLQALEASGPEVVLRDERQLRGYGQHYGLQVVVIVDEHLSILHEILNHVVL